MPVVQPHPLTSLAHILRARNQFALEQISSPRGTEKAFSQLWGPGAELAETLPTGVILHARWTRKPHDLGYTVFEPGDHFTEYFYTDRWHNIFEIRSGATGALKGWYCNVARPATISAEVVAAVDLFLDVWVRPDGSWLVLDEDEFSADQTLDAPTRAAALEALEHLLREISTRQPPFDQGADSE